MKPGSKAALALVAVLATPAVAPATAPAATIAVTTTADELNGAPPCSLREAVESANGDADAGGCASIGPYGTDTITLPAGTYDLSLGSGGENANQGGDLDITDDLAIDGQGFAVCGSPLASCIDANLLDRAVDLRNGADLTLRQMTIANGSTAADGGGLRAVQAGSDLYLTNVTVSGSQATDGGAIASTGGITVEDSLISGNSATANGGGVLQSGTTASISRSVVSGNIADTGSGGGLRIESGKLDLVQSTLQDNRAATGGGLSNLAKASVTASTLDANTALGTCIAGSGDGGAIRSSGPTSSLSLVNSTVSANAAGCRGGGLSLFAASESTPLTHLTVTGNSAGNGGAGVDADADTGGGSPVAFRGTILAGNSTLGATANCGGDGVRTSRGFNIEQGSGCGLTDTGDLPGTDPALAPLRFNGGPTRTQLPLTSSPAINAFDSTCPATDQRGVARPVGGRCDIGAVEASPAPLCAGFTVTLAGTAGPDSLTGTEGRDVIDGLGGNDTIQGLGGNDLLCGGDGDDVIAGGLGNDRVRGESGRDKLFGGPGNDLLEGGAGKDKLKGGPGRNKLRQ